MDDAPLRQYRFLRHCAGTRLDWTTQNRDDRMNDLRQAIRVVLRSPGFSLTVVVTLALGIGANATIFSLLDAVMFKPLPVPAAHELHLLYETAPDAGEIDLGGGSSRWTRFPYQRFERLRDAARGAGHLAAMTPVTRFDVRGDIGQRGLADVQLVSGNYFDVFRIGPAHGRVLTDDDNRRIDGHPVAVLSHRFWQQRFGGDPAIVGRTIRINQVPFTVVGVAAEGFAGDRVERPVGAWMPLMMQHAVRYESNVGSYGDADESQAWAAQPRISWLYLVLRTPAGVTTVRAPLENVHRQEMTREAATVPDREFAAALLQRRLATASFENGFSSLRRVYSRRLGVLMAMVAVLLLVACANVASLMLARTETRRRDIGIRLALGAGRGRLVWQMLIEAVLLSSAGAAAGALAAKWAAAALAAQVLGTAVTPVAFELDLRVLAFCAVLTIATSLAVGIAPALRATGAGVANMIGIGRGASSRSGTRGMAPLVVAQIACSLVLIVAGVWFARSLDNLSRIDPGFGRDQLVSLTINTRNSGYTPDELPGVYARVSDRLSALSGVESVAFAECTLLTGCTSTSDLRIEGDASASRSIAMNRNRVMPGYFETVGLRIVDGRPFEPADAAQPVAVVNEAFATRYFQGTTPIGKRIGSDALDTRIVGVVADARVTTIATAPLPMYYLPLRAPAYAFSLDVRVGGNPSALVVPIQAALSDVEPRLIVDSVTTMNDRIARSLFRETLVASLTATFSVITVLLAALGLYGLLSYATARRRAEIGVRVALGAQRHDVVGLVIRDALKLLIAGALLGTVGATVARRMTEPLLFEVDTADALTVSIAVAVLAVAAAAACYLPVRRATSVDPVVALKTD
jgi:predicted permease